MRRWKVYGRKYGEEKLWEVSRHWTKAAAERALFRHDAVNVMYDHWYIMKGTPNG